MTTIGTTCIGFCVISLNYWGFEHQKMAGLAIFDKRWLVDQKNVVRGAASGQELSRYSLHSPWPFFYGHFSCQEGVETAGRQDPEASLWVQWYLGCTCCTDGSWPPPPMDHWRMGLPNPAFLVKLPWRQATFSMIRWVWVEDRTILRSDWTQIESFHAICAVKVWGRGLRHFDSDSPIFS